MTDRKTSGRTAGRKLNRRDFLKLGGAGLAGAALLGTAGCGGSSGSGDLIFTMGPDDGSIGPLVEKFNKQSKEFKVQYREMSATTDAYFDKIKTQFQAGAADISIIGGDVIWPAQLAAQGWILDVSDRFPKSEQAKFTEAPIQTLIYEGKIYGVPWHTDAGLLYYRADLLDKAGYSEPPKTWPELMEMAERIMKDEGVKDGFVFQGDEYEGGVCNGLEYIWTHGGEVLDPSDPNKVVIDSPEAVAGLATEASLVQSGITRQAVANYTEELTDPAFMGGDAVFARNWPYMYAFAGTEDYIKPEQVGISPLPLGEGQTELASCLGGWNMLINATTDKPDEAWEFVKFMTSEESMRFRALEATVLPPRTALLSDSELQEKIPVIAQGEAALKNARPRPVSPYYSDMSLEMAEQFNASLKGDVSPEEAVKTLQKGLEEITQAAS